MTNDELQQRLLYRDGLLLVLDKPSGLPVHPGPKGGETLSDHLDALRFGLKWRPELAHRLDKDTSGCLVLGRHPKALRDLNALFAAGKVNKTYWAIVEGGPADAMGEIDLALAPRDPENRASWWMKHDPQGLPSLTRYNVLGRGHDRQGKALTWLALEPVTGRTHQLRVHCAESGFPILGDTIYGDARRFGGPGLHLHARAVSIPLSRSKPAIKVEAPVPEHMLEALLGCGFQTV